ncbi:MAG: hypothetical protein Q7S63_02630, partial [bacterium]|nr:hypothetical protein [bacterium]
FCTLKGDLAVVILMVAFLWIVNLVISIFNAIAVGNAWVETKHAGGFPRFLNWMGALMAASGFTWCYFVVIAIIAGTFGWFNEKDMEVFFSLGYLLIIPGVIFSGFMILIDSWARAYRERTIANVGVAGYNTFAQLYNTYNAISGIPEAWESVLGFFGDSDTDTKKLFLIVLLVMVAFGAGIITTWMIVSRVAANDEALPVRQAA